MRANQLRLWFAGFAYILLCAVRRIGLKRTQFAKANCATIRLRLLKIGALVRVSVRRIKLAMAVNRRRKVTPDRRPKLTPPLRSADGSARPGGAGRGCAAGASAVR